MRVPARLLALALVLCPLGGRAQNLLINPNFDTNTNGWRALSPQWTVLQRSPLDANGSPASGSLLIGNGSPVASAGVPAVQCVPALPGRTYVMSGKMRVRSGQSETGGAIIQAAFYSDDSCGTGILGWAVGNSHAFDVWETAAKSSVSPAGTKSAQVYLYVSKTEAGGSFEALFDDLSLVASNPATLTVPASASIHGNAGAFFHSDLWAMNRSYVNALTVTARFRCFASQSCPSGTKSFTLQPRQSTLYSDVVGGLFASPETAGAIELTYDSGYGQLSAASRVYTPNLPSPTNGAAVPAYAASEAKTRALFVGLGHNGGDLSSGFRSNAGAYNPNASSADVTFSLVNGVTGSAIGAPLTRTWGPNEAYQISDVFSAVGAGSTVTRSAYLIVTATAPVFPYVTVIDNQSGDSVWVNPMADDPAAPLAGVNLVEDSGFDGGIGNWRPFNPAVTAQVSPLDATGKAGSGSLLVTNAVAQASYPGNYYQCVPAAGGKGYVFTGWVRVPSGQAGAGYAYITPQWYATGNCSGGVVRSGFSANVTATDVWVPLSGTASPPSNALTAAFYLVPYKPEAGGQFQALFDDLRLVVSQPVTLTIPASASIHGNAGAFFHSDVWVTNRSPLYSQTVTATYRCFSGQSCGTPRSFSVAPLQTRLLSDAVGTGLFNAPETAGAIELTYESTLGAVSAASRVYTPSLPSPTNGTAVPAYASGEAKTRALFLGLGANGGNFSSGFRTNVGAYNPGSSPVSVTFLLFNGPTGTYIGAPLTRTWAPNEAYQINDVFAAVGSPLSMTNEAYLVVTSTAPIYPYVTVIDNQSGDSVWVNPQADEAP